MYQYEYPRPSVTVDCVIFGLTEASDLRVLLIQRKDPPFAGTWALPGGFVDMDEDLDTAARRELEEETGIHDVYIEQLYTFGQPQRDPRGRVISIAYYALVNLEAHPIAAGSDADQAAWFSIETLPKLAFDHAEILAKAIDRLRAKVRYQPIGFELLPEKFTLTELEDLYRKILGREHNINRRNFRSKMLRMGILEAIERQKQVAHRPAWLYRFEKEKYQELTKRGFVFEI